MCGSATLVTVEPRSTMLEPRTVVSSIHLPREVAMRAVGCSFEEVSMVNSRHHPSDSVADSVLLAQESDVTDRGRERFGAFLRQVVTRVPHLAVQPGPGEIVGG